MKSGGGGWQSESVRTAFNLDRRPERDHRTTAAVNDAKKLFHSKLKDLGAYPWVIGNDSHSYLCLHAGSSPAEQPQQRSGFACAALRGGSCCLASATSNCSRVWPTHSQARVKRLLSCSACADGFLGTHDPDRFPSYEGLAVGPHPHDPGAPKSCLNAVSLHC